jgi:hypothetical protein
LDMKEQAMITHIKWLEQRFQKTVAVVIEEDREMELHLNDKLDQMISLVETELRVLQGRLNCIEHVMAQTVEKLDSLNVRQRLNLSRSNVSDRYPPRETRLVTPAPTPGIFCSRPIRTHEEFDDDVRSL